MESYWKIFIENELKRRSFNKSEQALLGWPSGLSFALMTVSFFPLNEMKGNKLNDQPVPQHLSSADQSLTCFLLSFSIKGKESVHYDQPVNNPALEILSVSSFPFLYMSSHEDRIEGSQDYA